MKNYYLTEPEQEAEYKILHHEYCNVLPNSEEKIHIGIFKDRDFAIYESKHYHKKIMLCRHCCISSN